MMKLIIPGHRSNLIAEVADFAEASAVYSNARDESGEGQREFREGRIVEDGKVIARVSYNGRVWSPAPWAVGDEPIYDNRVGVQ